MEATPETQDAQGAQRLAALTAGQQATRGLRYLEARPPARLRAVLTPFLLQRPPV